MPLDMLPPAEPSHIDNAELALLPRNDAGNARRLLARHGHEMAWVKEIGWLVWDGRRWAAEAGDEAAYLRAEATTEAIYDEADELPGEPHEGSKKKVNHRERHRKFALDCGNVQKISSMLKAASSRLKRQQQLFDADPMLLNVANGTLELGDEVRLREHRSADLMTRIAAVPFERNAACPKWQAFIDTILPDQKTQLFMQKWLGHNLTGDISEQCFMMLDGKGSNGKSTMMEVTARVLGEYADTVPIESFLHSEGRKGSEASPDLACLRGVRLIRTAEPEPGARLSESRIKSWTGGEPVKARELHKSFMTFTPSGKITMSCNIRPRVAGKDEGIKTRIIVVPFKHRFPRREGGRKEAYVARMVKEEGSGILNWLLDGFRMWWEEGLTIPDEVKAATEAMFRDQDPIGVALGEIFRHSGRDEDRVQASAAYDAFVLWCKRNAVEPKSKTAFGNRLRDLDYRKKAMAAGNFYVGIDIHADYLPEVRRHGGDGDV
jgi:putative DNA primase/helicase